MRSWIGEGGIREDSPICRTARHFHDPLHQADGTGRGPWGSASLRTLNPLVAAACGGTSFPSSVHWAQEPNQTLGERGAWQDARRFFHNALTASEPGDREQAFADTFRALGQQMHLVVDASVPEHVRNDPHVMESILRGVGLRGHGSYEHWVSDQQGRPGSQQEAAFITRYLSSPFAFDPAILQQPTNDAQARVPVARLIDTDLYQAIDPNVTLGSAIGIAEFANANFFSEDTGSPRLLLPNYPFPDQSRLVPSQHAAPQPGRVRAYYAKGPGDGLPADPVLAECLLDEPARHEGILQPRTYTCVDENVWAQVAQVMLPRAIGYARGVLDYFFRGTLDFTIGGSSPNQTLTITNKSDEAIEGTFTLYADNFSNTRSVVTGASFNLNLGPGVTSGALNFTPPAEVQAYILVFQGKLGLEEGAVASKVNKRISFWAHAATNERNSTCPGLAPNDPVSFIAGSTTTTSFVALSFGNKTISWRGTFTDKPDGTKDDTVGATIGTIVIGRLLASATYNCRSELEGICSCDGVPEGSARGFTVEIFADGALVHAEQGVVDSLGQTAVTNPILLNNVNRGDVLELLIRFTVSAVDSISVSDSEGNPRLFVFSAIAVGPPLGETGTIGGKIMVFSTPQAADFDEAGNFFTRERAFGVSTRIEHFVFE